MLTRRQNLAAHTPNAVAAAFPHVFCASGCRQVGLARTPRGFQGDARREAFYTESSMQRSHRFRMDRLRASSCRRCFDRRCRRLGGPEHFRR